MGQTGLFLFILVLSNKILQKIVKTLAGARTRIVWVGGKHSDR